MVKANIQKGKKSSTHKYDIKISKRKKRVEMQHVGNAWEIERLAT